MGPPSAMHEMRTILNQSQLALGEDNVRLRAALGRWVRSRAFSAPTEVLGAISAQTATVSHYQRRLHKVRPATRAEHRVYGLLWDSLAQESEGLHNFQLGVAAAKIEVRVASLQASQAKLKSAATLTWAARRAAGCHATC